MLTVPFARAQKVEDADVIALVITRFDTEVAYAKKAENVTIEELAAAALSRDQSKL